MEAAKKIKTAGEILLKMLLVAVFIMPFYIAVVYALKSPEETMKTGFAFPKNFTGRILQRQLKYQISGMRQKTV